MSKRLCICIPTKNQPERVRDVLMHALPVYAGVGLSVVYFDSSDDSSTERIIKEFKGRARLHYQKMDPDLCLDKKSFLIFRDSAIIREYEYIWYLNDSISIRGAALDRIYGILGEGYDLIRLQPEGSGVRDDFISSDINEWFHKASRGVAHMGSTIMSRSLLLASPDWDDLYRKYVVTDDMYSPEHEFFFTLGFYYEQIARLPEFRGILIGNTVKWRKDSRLKKGESYWNHIPFEVWVRSYPRTIFKLPDCYIDKEDVVRESDNIMHGRFERQSMIAYRIRGILTPETAERYRDFWPYVSTLSFEEICGIASTPPEVFISEYGMDYGNPAGWEDKLEAIEQKLRQERIIVYGAGLYGEYVIEKLVADGWEGQIEGIAVSDAKKNVDEIDGFPVREISAYLHMKDSATVIIAALPDTAKEIMKAVEGIGFHDIQMVF